MYYLVDTNVFLHAICDEIYTVASLCKENDQEMTITETILNELEPGYYLEIEDETAKAAYNAVHNKGNSLGEVGRDTRSKGRIKENSQTFLWLDEKSCLSKKSYCSGENIRG